MRGPALLFAVLVVTGCGNSTSQMDLAMPDMAVGGCTTAAGTVLGPKVVSTPNPQSYVSELGGQVAVSSTGNVLVTFGGNYMLDSTSVQGAFVLSTDGGNTFSAPAELPAPAGTITRTMVPVADAQGNLWVFSNPFHPLFDAYDAVMLYKLPAGSTTFNAGIHVEDPTSPDPGGDTRLNRPWLLIRSDGQPLATWGYATLAGIRVATTLDGGMTWSRTAVVTNSNLIDLGQPCQAKSGGRVWVVYLTGSTSVPISARLRWSDDGGVTWPDANASIVSDPAEGAVTYAQPYCVSDGTHLYVLYGLPAGDPVDLTVKNLQRARSIKLAVSTDGGASFTRSDVGDPAAGATFFAPNLTLESSGALDLVYYAGASVDDPAAKLVRARSTDGTTFCSAADVQTGLTLAISGYGSAKSVGRFIGQTTANGAQYLSYVDNSGATGHVAFAKVTP